MSKTKVHKVVLLIVDHDNVGTLGICQMLQDANYPNDCIGPRVVDVETREIVWSDKHSLNGSATMRWAFWKLFKEEDREENETCSED